MRLSPDVERKCLEMAGLVDQPAADDVLSDDISEEDLQAKVFAFARDEGWTVYHTRISIRSEAGLPDGLFWRHSDHFVAELKSKNGVVSPAQKRILNAYRKANIPTYVWRPEHYKEIKERLRRK